MPDTQMNIIFAHKADTLQCGVITRYLRHKGTALTLEMLVSVWFKYLLMEGQGCPATVMFKIR